MNSNVARTNMLPNVNTDVCKIKTACKYAYYIGSHLCKIEIIFILVLLDIIYTKYLLFEVFI